jgi:hypothetical protein
MKRAKLTGPTKPVAAGFLRALADGVNVRCDVPEQRAADLRLIADCIEGRARWGKPRKHSIEQQQQINLAACQVEFMRPPGVSISAALDVAAKQLAVRLCLRGPDEDEKARALIVEARKRQRAAGWPTLVRW